MAKANPNTRLIIASALFAGGWIPDRYGNFKKTYGPPGKASRQLRIKMNDISMRYETLIESTKQWVNIRSDYYKNIEVNGNKVVIRGYVLP